MPAPASVSLGRFKSGICVWPRSSFTSTGWQVATPEAALGLLDSRLGSREMDGESGAPLSAPDSLSVPPDLLLRTGEAVRAGTLLASGTGEGGSNLPSMVRWRHLLRSGPGHSGSAREDSTGRETETFMHPRP